MVERKVEIINKLGLHARAAAKVVHAAGRYACDISLLKDGEEVDAKSILGILQLGAARGMVIGISCDGQDEEAALQAIVELFQSRFGEDA